MNKYLFMTGFHQLGIQYSSALSETTCSSGAAALYQQGEQQRPSAPKHPAALPAERPQPSQQGNSDSAHGAQVQPEARPLGLCG